MSIDPKEMSTKLREKDDAYIEEMSAYIQKISSSTKQDAMEALIRTNVIKKNKGECELK